MMRSGRLWDIGSDLLSHKVYFYKLCDMIKVVEELKKG